MSNVEPITRLDVLVNDPTADAVTGYTASAGVTVTEAARRLIAWGTAIAATDTDGKAILLCTPRRSWRDVFWATVTRLVLIPTDDRDVPGIGWPDGADKNGPGGA